MDSESDQSKEAVVLVKREVGGEEEEEEEVEKGRSARKGFRERRRAVDDIEDPIRDAIAAMTAGGKKYAVKTRSPVLFQFSIVN